jgi:hypothetical protein
MGARGPLKKVLTGCFFSSAAYIARRGCGSYTLPQYSGTEISISRVSSAQRAAEIMAQHSVTSSTSWDAWGVAGEWWVSQG